MKLFFIVSVCFLLYIFVFGVNGDKQISAVKPDTRDEPCGADVTWSLSNGILTIKGTGEMYDYGMGGISPFSKIQEEVTELVIEEGVTTAGEYAFYGCSFTTVTLPSSLAYIGSYSFWNCPNLSQVIFPAGQLSLKTIGSNSFEDCYNLTQFTFPSTVTSIESYAFERCCSLTQIELPDSLESVGTFAFNKCSNLTHVFIPAGLKSLSGSVFAGCPSLTSIVIDENNKNFTLKDGVVYDYQFTTIVLYPAGITDNYFAIPDGVESIADAAFSGCEHLIGVTIPSSVVSIGNVAFADCTNLSSIEIPSSVTFIGTRAFSACTSLTSISIPSSVKTLDIK